ncbi:L-threonine ammonia-lyase-like [Bacillus rossius redtenbacheri]|uniref:L-threonine ammonia-lyase-like n=1 Tax=Bacillus rossius redtenbacheri TaxID=93214 RepID=UPI002FDEB611
MDTSSKGLILRIGIGKGAETDDAPSQPQEPPKFDKLAYEEIVKYYGELRPEIQKTPCKLSRLCEELEMELYYKNEIENFTGSFMERAARGSLMSLSEEERARGVVAASWGNFGAGLSYHGKLLGTRVKLFMPETTSACKVDACRAHGAEVELRPGLLAECVKLARRDAELTGAVFAPGCDSIPSIASSGTIGMEILEDVPAVDAVLVQVGGAGLLAGVATAIKHVRPDTQIIAVESDAQPTFYESMRKGAPVRVPGRPTLASGLAVARIGPTSFYNARRFVDKTVKVCEDMIADAMRTLLMREKMVVEGAGAATMAALMHCGLAELKKKKVVIILTGGNVDFCQLCHALGCAGEDVPAAAAAAAAGAAPGDGDDHGDEEDEDQEG